MKLRRTTAEECELHFMRAAPAGMDFFLGALEAIS
jgi:hypothetical protein